MENFCTLKSSAPQLQFGWQGRVESQLEKSSCLVFVLANEWFKRKGAVFQTDVLDSSLCIFILSVKQVLDALIFDSISNIMISMIAVMPANAQHFQIKCAKVHSVGFCFSPRSPEPEQRTNVDFVSFLNNE